MRVVIFTKDGPFFHAARFKFTQLLQRCGLLEGDVGVTARGHPCVSGPRRSIHLSLISVCVRSTCVRKLTDQATPSWVMSFHLTVPCCL